MKFFTFALMLSTTLINCTALADAKLDQNKKLVVDFYNMAFNEKKPAEAMKKFVGDKYTQHNPFAGDGKQAFIDFFTPFFAKNKETSAEIKRVIAENDLVVVHVHSRMNKADRGRAVVDIFRVENGKIVEHWDVAQDIPEKQAHSNTMF